MLSVLELSYIVKAGTWHFLIRWSYERLGRNKVKYNSSECFEVSQQPVGLPRKNIETNSGSDPENKKLLFSNQPIRK